MVLLQMHPLRLAHLLQLCKESLCHNAIQNRDFLSYRVIDIIGLSQSKA